MENNLSSFSKDPLSFVCDMREYDVPYDMRVAIDLELNVGSWFMVKPISGSEGCDVEKLDMLELCEPRVLAFDIECEKSPLKFPNAEVDRIFMISYMIDGKGFLLINREIVSKDVDDFDYDPLPKFPGPFTVINNSNEEELLRKFISHIQELKPHVIVTYNGDFFDWPYVENRCNKFDDLLLYKKLGFRKSAADTKSETGLVTGGQYVGRCIVHLDAFHWVQRDSYLPQGSQGLKAVTKAKLGYDPVEVDPEDMVRLAIENPDYMASYSVSDAVATYYLYKTYVHYFIFSLATIIPMGPEDVLYKGSGTLCEALLMVEAYKGNIVCPNKQVDPLESFYGGHLLESETYIGGHVECLESGIYRSDFPAEFKLIPSAFQQLIDNIDRDLAFALETEHGIQRSSVVNYEQIKQDIICKLEMLRDSPIRDENPVIYHLDVGAMYPNIILTNRLQPSAMVTEIDCASCEFNKPQNNCKRPMNWTWRGDYNPATMSDYVFVKNQLAVEKPKNGEKLFIELHEIEQSKKARQRLKDLANRTYKKSKVTKEELREKTVCMRENAFYVDTVKNFRDRRYDYKIETKKWKDEKVKAEKKGDSAQRKHCEDKEILMDSLQLAHKCILNSFYGYVMRKGARWRSMEMAGIVTHTGSNLIQQARELVEQVGRPLELDTDGIWCILPNTFPQDFKFSLKNGGKIGISYPCAMLNADVHERYTNHQYQNKKEGMVYDGNQYDTHSECSIYFELDGPYKAMILPASPEEGRLLKKKYVVYKHDGSIAELKGFEIKRRGELELVKIFQEEVFYQFLAGSSLQSCYDAVGAVANKWLDVLDNHGMNFPDDELMQLISERKTISKTLEEYEGKGTSLTSAKRLADFLGAEMIKDKGLNCHQIISRLPAGAPIAERALPIAIFSSEPKIKKHYLRKWLKDPSLNCDDFREVVDWDYYKDRLGKSIQKIITIPAGIQRIQNPCPRIEHPPWLQRKLADSKSGTKQAKITSIFKALAIGAQIVGDNLPSALKKGKSHILTPSKDRKRVRDENGLLVDENFNTSNASPIIDVEDIGKIRQSGEKIPIPIVHYRRKTVAFDESLQSPKAPETSESVSITASQVSIAPVNLETIDVKPLSEEKPASLSDLQLWLGERKKKWKSSRIENRKIKSKNSSFSRTDELDALSRKKVLGLTEFGRRAELEAMIKPWQIFEIQSTESPGEFTIWAMTSRTQMQKFKVVVPRIIYVNCRGKDAQAAAVALGGTKNIERFLPHGHPCINLYEIEVPERKFQRNEKALARFLHHPQVEGVYETQVPLWFRTVVRLGCVSQVNKKEKVDSFGNSFKLSNLDMLDTSHHDYLTPLSASFKKVYIYYSSDRNTNRGRGAIGMFVIERAANDGGSVTQWSAKAHIWVSNGGVTSYKVPFQKIFNAIKQSRQMDQSDSVDEGIIDVKFVSVFVSSMTDALKACNERVATYVRERHGPTLVLVQGIFQPRQWRRKIPSLQEFPLLTVPYNSQDDMLPAMQWAEFIAKRMIQRYLYLPKWFDNRLQCARFAQIPVCNIGPDARTTMTDVLYARVLNNNRHIMWTSEKCIPDLGGAEEDEHGAWSDKLVEPSMNNPGAYRNLCVELSIEALDYCAILSSSDLDAEGLTAVGINIQNDGDNQHVSSDSTSDSSCGRAFSLLKALVSKWHDDTVYSGDIMSRSLLESLYRYLCGYGEGMLHDPAIHRIVYGLMTKLFKRLISEFKRLGAKVIYADFRKIVVYTNKYDRESANEYINFIVNAIVRIPTFSFLEIHTKTLWEQLLWLGPDNYCGIIPNPGESTDSLHQEDYSREQSEEFDYAASTNEDDGDVMTSLHEDYNTISDNSYKNTVSTDISTLNDDDNDDESVHNHRQNSEDDNLDWLYEGDKAEVVDDVVDDNNVIDDHNEEPVDEDPYFIFNWTLASNLPVEVKETFKVIIKDFLYRFKAKRIRYCQDRDEVLHALANNPDDTSLIDFCPLDDDGITKKTIEYMAKYIKQKLPKIIGDEIDQIGKSSDMKLDFIKAVTHVLSIDSSVEEDIANLKRYLLNKIGVKEFAEESQFSDTSYSYVLRDIICSHCSTSSSKDLLRDFDFTTNRENRWICYKCKHYIDTVEIEDRLINDAEGLSVSYLLQDMRCSKTNEMITLLCAATSNLCAPIAMLTTPLSISHNLNILHEVATKHQFHYLEKVVKQLKGI